MACHSIGQTLHVTDGVGYVQFGGGPLVTIRPGDVVRIGPGEEHWLARRRQTTHEHPTTASEAGDGAE